MPLTDDSIESESAVVSASIIEPYILLQKDNSSVLILRADEAGELEELDETGALSSSKWISGSLFNDINDYFRLTSDAMEEEDLASVLAFLLTTDGGLQVFRLPNLGEPLYAAPGLSFLPQSVSTDFTIKRSTARESLTELVVTELGDATHKTPYLILRSSNDDLTIYMPYQDAKCRASDNSSLKFSKISNYHLPVAFEEDTDDPLAEQRTRPLRAIHDLDGYSSVFMPGPAPCLIVKSTSSEPKVITLREGQVPWLVGLNTTKCPKGLAYVDRHGHINMANVSSKTDYSIGWSVQTLYSSNKIRHLDYHGPSNRFVISTSKAQEYKLPIDELHPEWQTETATLLPTLDEDTIELVDPATMTIIDTYNLEGNETVLCVETINLVVSEVTLERRPLICIGTCIARGEDINTMGCVYIFDVIDVVPWPGKPETGKKLKLLSKIREKGAVTALSKIGTEGFVLVAQGQKCLVRGLKEDNTLLPVAFIDIQCHTNIAKELNGTGLCVLGDAIKGAWLVGYMEEPYALKLLSKNSHRIEVVAAEFLADQKGLYIVVADENSTLHILECDPHNPKSLSGQRLLHLTSFHTGAPISTMTLLPRTPTSYQTLSPPSPSGESEDDQPMHQILLSSSNGSLSLLSSLSPTQYRTLSALQSYIHSALPHPLSCNTKAYRAVETDMSLSGRPVLDGNLLKRWMELGSWKRTEAITRVSMEGQGEWDIRGMLEGIGVAGLGQL